MGSAVTTLAHRQMTRLTIVHESRAVSRPRDPRTGRALGYPAASNAPAGEGNPAMAKTRAEVAQYLKDAGGLKLVVLGVDGHQVAALFVRGSVIYDEEEATFIAVAEDGHAVGELFVAETVDYDENTDAFVIPIRTS